MFIGARGKPVTWCSLCRRKYRYWGTMTLAEKLADRKREDPRPTGRVRFVPDSGNKKTGPIPVTISERGTCPPSFGLYQAGCYAEYGKHDVYFE